MPRNGSDGTFSLSDTVAPATLADADEVQDILDDIAAALTGSVAKDGQTALTGQLKGLVSANPAYSFSGYLTTGLGCDTANEAYFKCNGTKIFKVSSAGLEILSGALLAGGAQKLVPTGMVCYHVAAWNALAPGGWVRGLAGLSIGNASSGATELADSSTEELFTKIYNSMNVSGGAGQLQDSSGSNVARGANAAADYAANRRILVPPIQDRVIISASGTYAAGSVGGVATNTILQTNLPNLTLNTAIGAGQGLHAHAVPGGWVQSQVGGSAAANGDGKSGVSEATPINSATLPAMTGTTPLGGSGTALDNLMPYLALQPIIKL